MEPTLPKLKIREPIRSLGFSATLGINQHVKALRADGVEIAHLGFGESPFPVHPIIRKAVASNADKSLYLPSAGLPKLRELACRYFGDKLGFDGEAFTAIIGPGSKELIYDIQLAVEGDLLLPIPSWVSYAPQAILTGDNDIRIETTLDDRFHLTGGKLEKAVLTALETGQNPTKLIINFPNNPTGLSLHQDELNEIAKVCRKYGILVISDEIYALTDHRGGHVSIARYYPEGTIITTGLSKHISLGGYRLGVALVPMVLEYIFDAVVAIASETWSCVSAPIQYSAVKAVEKDPEIEDYIHTCTKIHSMIAGYLREIILDLGVEYPELDGAFYLYPDFDSFREGLRVKGIKTSEDLAKQLLNQARVATLPGSAFGDSPENLRLRLAACDYNGQAALDYFSMNPDCTPKTLVHNCCPNIRAAGQRLVKYFQSLR